MPRPIRPIPPRTLLIVLIVFTPARELLATERVVLDAIITLFEKMGEAEGE